jgi:hypothetical protein
MDGFVERGFIADLQRLFGMPEAGMIIPTGVILNLILLSG